MRFAVILHGPEVLDTGLGQRVMRVLRGKGQVIAVMSGYTGVAAVIDAGLEDEIDISRRRKPSIELVRMDKGNDLLLLVNCAKTRESALRFGSMVYSRCAGKLTRPFIQVDDGIIIDWTGMGATVVQSLADELGLELVAPPESTAPPVAEEDWRILGGIIPGENVWINGVVVGRATSDQVLIGKDEKGRLVAKGLELKEPGIKRLGEFDVRKAHVRSGLTRRTSAVPRSIDSVKAGIFLIDHAAEEAIYKCRDAALVISIGDDTSKITGALLYRFNVPVVAIIDGDEDGISQEAIKTKGSILIQVRPGTDDVVGAEIRDQLFSGGTYLPGSMAPQEAATRIMRLAGERVLGLEHVR